MMEKEGLLERYEALGEEAACLAAKPLYEQALAESADARLLNPDMSALVAFLPTTLVADRAGIAEAAADLPGPAVVVVGEVVALPERLLDTKLYLSQRFG
jgi:hypothetical protein